MIEELESEYEKAQYLQNSLVGHATGEAGNNQEYNMLRMYFMGNEETKKLLPSFVRTNRSLDQFWQFIKREFSTYAERRKFIWEAFSQLLEYLEGKTSAPADTTLQERTHAGPPHWQGKGINMKAFISYSTADKEKGAEVKNVLDKLGIESFLAHDDIRVSEEWERRILKELNECQLFIPLLSNNFKESDWCGQEAGIIANRRNVAIIPFSLNGTNPYGFISKFQGQPLARGEIITNRIIEAITINFPKKVVDILMVTMEPVNSYRHAESVMKRFESHFHSFTPEQAYKFANLSLENGQIWNAQKCKETYLPAFLEKNKDKLDKGLYEALQVKVQG